MVNFLNPQTDGLGFRIQQFHSFLVNSWILLLKKHAFALFFGTGKCVRFLENTGLVAMAFHISRVLTNIFSVF